MRYAEPDFPPMQAVESGERIDNLIWENQKDN